MAITAAYRNPKFQPKETKVIDGQAITYSDVLVHSFILSDVDDPEIYAAGPIWDWQHSEQGQWVLEHAVNEPWYTIDVDFAAYGYRCRIVARLSEQDQTFFKLKWN